VIPIVIVIGHGAFVTAVQDSDRSLVSTGADANAPYRTHIVLAFIFEDLEVPLARWPFGLELYAVRRVVVVDLREH